MLSSLKLSSTTILGKDQQKKLTFILSYLIDNPQAAQFLNPVQWEEMGLTDYPVVIKYPMNLLKVQQKLKAREYRTVQQILDHIQLIWDNCKQYNQGGPFYTLADKMQRSFKKMIKNYLPNIQVVVPSKQITGNPNISSTREVSHNNKPQSSRNISIQQPVSEQQPEQIPQSQKNRFNQRIKQITQQQLAQIVTVIQQNCSQAFKDMGNSRAQIVIDSLDAATFKKINQKIDDYLEGEKGPTKKTKTS